VVVMLTRLAERGVVKATAYWPEGEGEQRQFGPFVVTLVRSETIGPHLVRRVLDVEHAGQTRRVVQLHYTEWPDFGTPESTHTIRELARLVDEHREEGRLAGLGGPIVAHCSAGVGRAGTFLAIHISLEKMKHSGVSGVDIPNTVALLRRSRAGMVQTSEQYQLIHEAFQDAARELNEHHDVSAANTHATRQMHGDEL
jgi:protein tyrosine phosphatase